MLVFCMASSDKRTRTEQTNKHTREYPRGNMHGLIARLSDIINNSCNGITIELNEI